MSSSLPTWSSRLASLLAPRLKSNLHRSLTPPNSTLIDFSSNDYLGLVHSPPDFDDDEANVPKGSTGSRLLSGNTPTHLELEGLFTQKFFGDFALNKCLLFNSGYDANLSLLSSIPRVNDVIIADEECHNSTWMGIRMSRCENLRTFKHNDVCDLERVLDNLNVDGGEGGIIVPVESYYSMSGTLSPMRDILQLCYEKSVEKGVAIGVIVDEAHSTGVWGVGRGILEDLELTKKQKSAILASVHTFGKAFGSHGAVVLDYNTESDALREYLVNYARPFIYSTSLGPRHLKEVERNVEYVWGEEGEWRREKLFNNIEHFRKSVGGGGEGPIQSILTKDSETCVKIAEMLRENHGFNVYAIRPPTVKIGKERIRVVIHYHNEKEEIEQLVESARIVKETLGDKIR